MENIYLFKYNNLFNKKLLREETIAGYGTPLSITQTANFNPNDGVRTTQVVNADYLTSIPDYCVVLSESSEIRSRWFVVECRRTRMGQYQLQLLRDVMAEYRSSILASKCFIRKGYVPQTSPLVFNNENMGFNQIKTGEYLLQNNLKTPWLVLYLSRYNNEQSSTGSYNKFAGTFQDQPPIITPDYEVENIEDYEYYHWVGTNYRFPADNSYGFFAEYMYAGYNDYIFAWEYNANGFINSLNNGDYPKSYTAGNYPRIPAGGALDGAKSNYLNFDWVYKAASTMQYLLPIISYTNLGTAAGAATLSSENGKIIKVNSTGKYYRVAVELEYGGTDGGIIKINSDSNLGREYKSFFESNGINMQSNPDVFYINFPEAQMGNCYLNVQEVGDVSSSPITYDIEYTRSVTLDSVYEIIAAPYNDILFKIGSNNFRHNGDIALQWFQNIINKYHGAGNAYDLQLVPYCPIDQTDITDFAEDTYTYAERGNVNLAIAFKLNTSTFSVKLENNDIPVRNDYKLSNELDVYRIVSPNGVGEYEFSPAKNNGVATRYEADVTLIPFAPYIKINPEFQSLYGADYNDYRGLICKGDFSLPILNSAWETYKLNNKYYQDVFDRNIEHLEFNNKYQRLSEGVSALTGTVSGAIGGALVGGPIGALAGGIASAAGGAADLAINDKLRAENLDYQKDLYGYELGTIKARAQTLTRTTSYNINNKYFPYVEYYTCTYTEEQALKDKMKYNGMTVGVIGSPGQYLNSDEDLTYVQGELIEIDLPDDYQIAAEIASLLRGGYRIG